MRRATIFIQQDNASPHRISKEKIDDRCRELGIKVELYYQPSQSPDCNICDLSFFPSIQSRYFKIDNIKNIKDIIEGVKTAFRLYEVNILNRAFLSLMMNYNCILEFNGDNKYKTPHMKKQFLENRGMLPDSIRVWGRDTFNDDNDVDDTDDDADVNTDEDDDEIYNNMNIGMHDEVEWLIDEFVNDGDYFY